MTNTMWVTSLKRGVYLLVVADAGAVHYESEVVGKPDLRRKMRLCRKAYGQSMRVKCAHFPD